VLCGTLLAVAPVGFLVGLTSVGSGSLLLALLVLIVPLSAERLVGANVAHVTLLVGTAALAHFYLGHVDLALAGQLLFGSVPGVLSGSRLMLWVPRRALQVGLAGLLMASAVRLPQWAMWTPTWGVRRTPLITAILAPSVVVLQTFRSTEDFKN